MVEKSIKQYLRNFDVNKKLLSNIDNGVIILDEHLTIYYFNKWLEIHTSIKEDNVIEKKITDIFPNINIKTLQRKIRTALRMGTPSFYGASTSKYLIPIKINQLNVTDFKHMRQDVSIIPFDKDKKLLALIISDQTTMLNTNLLLETSINKVQELNGELVKERETIDNKVLLIKFDTKYIISNVSKAYLQLIGCNDKNLLHENFFEYYKLFINKSLKESILQHIEEQKVFHFENKILSLTGEDLDLSYTLVPEYDSYTKHIGFILFMQDITSNKKVIYQQEKLLATSRSAAMGEMISMIAHQWRQPLSVITTIMATIKVQKELDILDISTLDSSFSTIEDTVMYLSHTIDDFRDYFKPNKVISNISIKKLIEKSLIFIINEMKFLNISYNEDINEDIFITTYQNELIQCIINIFKNTLDAFKENSFEDKKIDISVKAQSSSISLTFEDNAGGIDKDTIQKVFEPYFSTKSKNGTGLGLYMTKTIIEEHLNGKITITSEKPSTTVVIELPYFIQKTKDENESNMPTLS